MRNMIWTINCLSTPMITHHCKKCNKSTEFISSDCFRVNAQGKYLDVWLIYNCGKCRTSWNSTILSRIHTNKIDSNLLHLFHENDASLAQVYGADKSILKKNGAEIKTIEYEVVGENFKINEPTVLQIHCKFPLGIKLSTILKNKLELSNAELKRLIDSGNINSKYGDLTKEKLQGDSIILFNTESELSYAKNKIP